MRAWLVFLVFLAIALGAVIALLWAAHINGGLFNVPPVPSGR